MFESLLQEFYIQVKRKKEKRIIGKARNEGGGRFYQGGTISATASTRNPIENRVHRVGVQTTVPLFFGWCVLAFALMHGCTSKQQDETSNQAQMQGGETHAVGNGNLFVNQIVSMRDRIRRHEASRQDMLRLCERLLADTAATRDSNDVGFLCFTYGTYCVFEGQADTALRVLRRARFIAAALGPQNQGSTLAGIDAMIARAYGMRQNYRSMVMTYKYIIDHYREVTEPSDQGPSRESHSTFAVREMQTYYESRRRYDEGIRYFDSLIVRYPDSRTGLAALSGIYDLQMARGQEASAAETKEKIRQEVAAHPENSADTLSVFTRWDKALR